MAEIIRTETRVQTGPPAAVCDGLCVSAADIGVGRADQIAYPHPSCPLHAPGQVCQYGQPDRCLSPTHAPPDDIEATGQCCCAGCAGMGPCDRAGEVARG